jgi:hypothetical protein
MYHLVWRLNGLGHEAMALCNEPRNDAVQVPERYLPFIRYIDESPPELLPDDIVIYPEIVSGNPLRARRVARFLMNRPWFLSGKGIDYGDSDYIVAYSGLIDTGLPQLFLLVDDREKFLPFRGGTEKRGVSVYFGKVNPDILQRGIPLLKGLSRHDRLVPITRQVPYRKDLLFRTIAESRLLVSFDPLSNLNHEATLLDTPVLLMDDSYGVMKGSFNIPLHGFFSDIRELDGAVSAAHRAWGEYESQLERQDAGIATWAAAIRAHFEKIDAAPSGEYAMSVAASNRSRKVIDEAPFLEHTQGTPLVNIEYPGDLPEEIQRILRIYWPLKLKKFRESAIDAAKAALKGMGLFSLVKRLYKSVSAK